VTGERDEAHLIDDRHSRQSLENWCVFDVVTVTEPRTGHEPADVSAFSRALDALLKSDRSRPDRLADCRARISDEMTRQMQEVEVALARGDRSRARRMLDKIDARYGGLAAPRSVELAAAQ